MGIDDLEQVNMHEAKTHLSKLVERVEAGAEIVINRAGVPAAKLVPVEAPNRAHRKLGVWEGMGIELPSDKEMAQMDKEIAEEFYGPEDEWPEDWKTK